MTVEAGFGLRLVVKGRKKSKCEIFGLRLDVREPWENLERDIPWNDLPNRGVFAVWNRPPGDLSQVGDCLFIAQDTGELRDCLMKLHTKWQSARKLATVASAAELALVAKLASTNSSKNLANPTPYDVWVETAASEDELFDPEYERRIQFVLSEVEQFRKLDDIETLKRIRAATERKGGKPGPKRRNTSDWKIKLLHELASKPSKSLKNCADYPETVRSVRVELGRFCRSFYERCILLGARTPESWQEPKKAQFLREEFGFAFPTDEQAASEAYRRGEEMFRRSFPEA